MLGVPYQRTLQWYQCNIAALVRLLSTAKDAKGSYFENSGVTKLVGRDLNATEMSFPPREEALFKHTTSNV